MSDSYDKDYPVHIELGREVQDYGEAVPVGSSTSKKKMRTIYPSLYIEDSEDLAKLQLEGWALIKYHRNSISLGEGGDFGPISKDDDDKNHTATPLWMFWKFAFPNPDGQHGRRVRSFRQEVGGRYRGHGSW